MDTLLPLLTITAALTLGVISPGPSFLMVARTALARSRVHGVAAALGMGVGGMLFALLALFGLVALLQTVPALHAALKVAGGLYLIWLGVRIWRGARAPLPTGDGPASPARPLQSFWLGFATQISNPKTAAVYASVFASLLPDQVPIGLLLTLPVVVFAIEAGWYAIVAIGLSASGPRTRYLRARTVIDRLAGALMTALGARLLFDARA